MKYHAHPLQQSHNIPVLPGLDDTEIRPGNQIACMLAGKICISKDHDSKKRLNRISNPSLADPSGRHFGVGTRHGRTEGWFQFFRQDSPIPGPVSPHSFPGPLCQYRELNVGWNGSVCYIQMGTPYYQSPDRIIRTMSQ